MGRSLALLVLGAVLAAEPAWAAGRFQKNVFGGWDYYERGRRVFSLRPNVFGGWDIHCQGRRAGYTRPNVFGGQDIYLGSRRVASTRQNVFGGQSYRWGNQRGHTRPNVFGGRDVFQGGRRVGTTRRGAGGAWHYDSRERLKPRKSSPGPRRPPRLLSDRELVQRLVSLFGQR